MVGTFSASPAIEGATMVQKLLIAGMLSGLVVAIAAFAFARVISEPSVERAIVIEEASEAHDHGQSGANAIEVPEVSRSIQRNLGLFVGIASYCVALGGLLALGSATLLGRVKCGARLIAWLLSSSGYVALILIPQMKYPANPPGVGSADTIATRTELYFLLLLVSACFMAVGALLAARIRAGGWSRVTALASGGVLYAMLAMTVMGLLPSVSEVPRDFPRGLLLEFRVDAALLQLIIWIGLGLVFGRIAAYVTGDDYLERDAVRRVPNA